MAAAVLAVCQGLEWLEHRSDFARWQEDRPLEAAVDFSRAGEVSAPLRQTCACSHGENAYLRVNPPLEKPAESLAEFAGLLIITDADGKEVVNTPLQAREQVTSPDGRDPLIASFVPFAQGDYRATIRVDTQAPALGGRQQVVYIKYLLCGLEHYPAFIMGVISLTAAAAAAIALGCVVPGLLRYGLRRPPEKVAEATVDESP